VSQTFISPCIITTTTTAKKNTHHPIASLVREYKTVMPPKLKHTVALDPEGRILTLLEYQRSTARPKVFCVCGCRQPLTLRKSRNLPGKRHIATHFALRGATRNTCRLRGGETFEHIWAKQLIVDNIYKIEFARLSCPTCRGRTQRVRFPPDVYARLEHRNIETNCIPDVTVYNSQGRVCFALEVRKTHAVPQHKLDLMQDHKVDVAEFDADDVIDCLCDEDASCDTVHLHNLLCCSVECSACAEAREIERQREDEREERERKRSEECDTLRHMNARQLHWIFKAMPQVQGMPGFILQ